MQLQLAEAKNEILISPISRNIPVTKKLITITTLSHGPAKIDSPANKNASIPAEKVPNPRLNPLMNVAPTQYHTNTQSLLYHSSKKHTMINGPCLPILNSNITMTVRMAQIEYWDTSSIGMSQNMSNETRANAKPILSAYTAFLRSFRPISNAFLAKSKESRHCCFNPLHAEARHEVCSSMLSMLATESKLFLLIFFFAFKID